MISSLRKKILPLCIILLLAVTGLTGICSAKSAPQMVTIQAVDIDSSRVVLRTDSSQLSFDSYKLGAPPRLVIDIMGALPEFSERSFVVDDGYSGVRVGLYADKTRFVFDAADSVLPNAQVVQQGNNLVVQWGDAAVAAATENNAIISSGKPLSVESIDFDVDNGVSIFKVKLSADAKLVPAVVDGDIIRFGIKNAVISRALRRVVDASVFPSAVLQIVPYSTIIAGERCVMFAATMKGPVDFSVVDNGSVLTFQSVDGPFAEAAPQSLSTVSIPINNSEPDRVMPADNVSADDQVAQVIASLSGVDGKTQLDAMADGEAVKVYTGELVSLVFDDVDIRKVMQLIAEVSDQNIILSDDVKGNISLRLHDVPWDQALDLVLEVKELGATNDGNVIRISTLKQIEKLKTERLAAKKEIVELQTTTTKVFDVNFRDVEVIGSAVEGILSDDGEIRTVNGSKKIVVNDVPSKMVEIQALIDQLDIAEKQVMIEARLVEVEQTEGLDLGVKWGFTYGDDSSGGISNLSSSSTGAGGSFLISPTAVSASSAGGIGTALTFGVLGVDSTVLDLRLSALEESGKGKIVSTPKVMALNGETAKISQGEEIPYQVVEDGDVTIEFKDAKLTLDVTPQINSDGSIILKIDATNSSRGEQVPTGELAIQTKEAHTTLMVNNGDTTVIGGIVINYEKSEIDGVPYLMDVPFIGGLFKSKSSQGKKSDFLIFITPRIIDL